LRFRRFMFECRQETHTVGVFPASLWHLFQDKKNRVIIKVVVRLKVALPLSFYRFVLLTKQSNISIWKDIVYYNQIRIRCSNNKLTIYANHHSSNATTKSEGNILMMRSFFISRILIPSPISRIPPTLVRPCTISGVKKVLAYMANSVMPP